MPDHFNMLAIAKSMGVKVICDMDDDNLSVPRDNPTYPQYAQMPVKEAILNLARHCDALQVSTEFMKSKYGIYNKNTVVIPNAIDDDLVKRRPMLPGDRENKVVWRGNPSQTKNLATIGGNIVEMAKRHPEWRWVFFGMEPYDLTEQIKNHECVPAMPLHSYFGHLCAIHGKLLVYPLHHQDHSQARSHISWLEATYANMAVLAYKNAEFTRPGCLNYASQTEFMDQMEKVMQGGTDISFHVEQSWNEIQEKYLLSKTNQIRFETIRQVLQR
jgi:glycosyltransferase involved in cell wall biosynthesis